MRGKFASGMVATAVLVAGLVAPSYAGGAVVVQDPDPPRLEVPETINLDGPVGGQRAVTALGEQLPVAAELNNMSAGELREVLLADRYARVDVHGRMFYLDPIPDIETTPREARQEASAAQAFAERSSTGGAFALHSKPGSNRVIFLDFDGATVSGTAWNAAPTLVGTSHPAWSLDGDASTYSAAERAAITSIWARVAEDYAPFDVDVTTEDPGDAAIERTNSNDPLFGTRVLISPSADASFKICQHQCGGAAYVDVFDDPFNHAYYQPAWVFPQNLGPNDTKAIAEAITHEVGHHFGLDHDGLGTPNTPTYQGYYAGHANWAPIMGVGYSQPLVQWSKGEYSNASTTQNDVATIADSGAPYRADEAPSTVAGAGFPTGDPAYISTAADVDVWDLGTCSGAVTVDADPAGISPNLDIELKIIRPDGSVVATVNPTSTRASKDVANGLAAAYSGTLTSGRYLVRIDGVGNGSGATGYTDYGSIGAYTLSHSGCSAGATAPGAPTGLSVTSAADGRAATLTWEAPANDGGTPLTGYSVQRVGGTAQSLSAATTAHTFTGLTPGTTYAFSVSASNVVGSGPAASANGTTNDLAGLPTSYAVTPAANGTSVEVTWTAPDENGGAAVTEYTVARTGASPVTVPAGTGTMSRTWSGLTPGATYTFTVAAVNAVGTGEAASEVVSLPVAPAEPTDLQVFAATNGRSAVVSWTAPPEDPRSPRTGYRVQRSGGSAATIGAQATSENFTGLTPGLTYTFSVAAINAVGTGSSASIQATMPNPIVPVAPGAPTALVVTVAANGSSATLSWSPPSSDGGSPVTGYTVNRSGGSPVALGPGSSSHVFTGLTRGTRYTFSVHASNTIGAGPAASKDGTTPDLPGTPTSVSVTPAANGQSATLTWAAPSSDGGSALTGYVVQRTGASSQPVGTTPTSATFSGLTPGQTYTFTVAAVNAVGTGSGDSDQAQMPVPATAPSAPTSLSVSTPAHGTSATLSWSAPASDGGSAVTGFVVGRSGASSVTLGAGASSHVFTGLAPGTTYTFSVAAKNAVDTGTAATKDATTPTPAEPSVPGSATSVGLTAADNGQSATLTWSPPASDGGSPITGYRVQRTGGPAQDLAASAREMVFTGLTQGATYTFSVRALNAVGAGSASTVERTMPVPPEAPGVPGDLNVILDHAQRSAAVTWSPPTDDGGAEITGYQVIVNGVGLGEVSGTEVDLTDLARGQSYDLDIRAVNVAGAGDPAQTTFVVADVPGQPTAVTIAPAEDGASATLTWAAPDQDGGSPIEGYAVSGGAGSSSTASAATSSFIFEGLAPGASYTFSVAATNAAGPGEAVAVQATMPTPEEPEEPVDPDPTDPEPTAPGAPTFTKVKPGKKGGKPTALVKWRPPSGVSDAAPIKKYRITAFRIRKGKVVAKKVVKVSADTRRVVLRLPRSKYRFTVQARNKLGWGDRSTWSKAVRSR